MGAIAAGIAELKALAAEEQERRSPEAAAVLDLALRCHRAQRLLERIDEASLEQARSELAGLAESLPVSATYLEGRADLVIEGHRRLLAETHAWVLAAREIIERTASREAEPIALMRQFAAAKISGRVFAESFEVALSALAEEDHPAYDRLNTLLADLAHYEPDREARDRASYFGDERLHELVLEALRDLDREGAGAAGGGRPAGAGAAAEPQGAKVALTEVGKQSPRRLEAIVRFHDGEGACIVGTAPNVVDICLPRPPYVHVGQREFCLHFVAGGIVFQHLGPNPVTIDGRAESGARLEWGAHDLVLGPDRFQLTIDRLG